MKNTAMFLAAVMMLAAGSTSVADVDLKDVKCVVASKSASADKSVDYKEGKVYFCCGGCASKFESNKEKFAAKANHQLVATKQYEQKGCPFSGQEVDPEKYIKLAGTKIGFCCEGCKSRAESAKDDASKMKLVFNDKAFKKAFAKAKAE